MFKRLLVPLDGSPRAEQAIPVAARIARASGGSLLLLHVTNLNVGYGPYFAQASTYTGAILEAQVAGAKVYLARVAHKHHVTDIETEIEVITGLVAPSILTYAQLRNVDLIVMCSHRYSGLKRWALGSVAQQITRQGSIPVLVLRESGSMSPGLSADPTHPPRALVALDGSPFAESAIIPAAHLVAALAVPPAQGTLHLMQVVKLPTVEGELAHGRHTIENREQAIYEAGVYLQSVRDKLVTGLAAELQLQVTWSTEESKDVAETFINVAEHGEGKEALGIYDLIVLATHGRGGLQRWLLGSVTERVLGNTKLPLLIVRPQAQPAPTPAGPMRAEVAAS